MKIKIYMQKNINVNIYKVTSNRNVNIDTKKQNKKYIKITNIQIYRVQKKYIESV